MFIQKLRYSNYSLVLMLIMLPLVSPYARSSPYLNSNSWLQSLATMFVLHSAINRPDNQNSGFADAKNLKTCEGSCQFEPQLHEYFKGTVVLFVRIDHGPCPTGNFDEKEEIWFGLWNRQYKWVDFSMMKLENHTLDTEKGYEGRFSYSYKGDAAGANLKIFFKDVQPEEAGFYGARIRYDSFPPVIFRCDLELRHIHHGPVNPNIAVLQGNEARFQYRFNPTVDNEIPSLDSVRFGPQQKNGSIETYLYWQKDKVESISYQNAERQVPMNFSSPGNTSLSFSNLRNISLDLSNLGNYTFTVTMHGVNVTDAGRYLCDIEVTRSLKTFHTLTTDLVVKANLSDPEVIEASTQSPFSQTHTFYPGDTRTQKADLANRLNSPIAIHQELPQQECLYPNPDWKKLSRDYSKGIETGIAVGIPVGFVLTTIAAGIIYYVRNLRKNHNHHLIEGEFIPNYDVIILDTK
ncbi:hypothetical protein [Endozoicomonas sp. ALD040]|uniref:hypothetical protein n=1 Tax=Endozoicomonas sp. ALD040 TaxID=3403079 RepID=UPI003BB0C93A